MTRTLTRFLLAPGGCLFVTSTVVQAPERTTLPSRCFSPRKV
jgi:hypothetical protein